VAGGHNGARALADLKEETEMRFDGKVVFITGGAIGFGRAFARAFVAEGAAVVIADIDDRQAEETAAALRESGAKALAVHCDVAKESEVEAAVAETTAEFGGVDVLFNNAGLHLLKYNQPFSVLARDDLRALFDVNVVGIVNCTLACKDSMRERGGGAVVNISSIASHLSTTPYGVSKLAVRGLTVALATELADDRIRVNAIAPGLMATENAMDGLPQDMVDDFVAHRQLVHRLGTMDDIVATALFLCSADAGFITGETLRVSGGYPLSL
jgi:NAD(P)-dependent dehydrogenase (short-subunit alcohol dehydrogenase family)